MRKQTIVLIEDSEADAWLLQRHLKEHFSEAFYIARFAKLAPAEDFIREKEGDIFAIVTDLMLPDTAGGEETFSRLKSRTGDDIPIIIITGSDDSALKRALVREGAEACISKDLLFDKPVFLQDALYLALHRAKKPPLEAACAAS